MANEKRLIDANLLIPIIEGEIIGDRHEILNRALSAVVDLVRGFPAVDAVVLPCKIGDDVYIIPSKVNFELNVLSGLKKNNRVYHQKVAEIVFTQDCWYARGNADKEFGTGRVLPDVFYKKTWFLTEEEAESALAKMDGGNEDG